MATPSKLTIRVRSARTSSDVSVTTAGTYNGLAVNTVTFDLQNQPVQPTTSAKAFWLAVLAAVQAELNTL